MLGTVKAEGLGHIGSWGEGTSHSSRGPVENRMAGYIKQKEMGVRGILQI